ncbi:MAG: biotin synthase BioB [Polyangiaceae bacterium]|nr:biotin synthase BioB [Polyangiaceae bacterium]
MTPEAFEKYATDLALSVAAGEQPDAEAFQPLVNLPDHRLGELMQGVHVIRRSLAPQGVHLCTICNVKSGLCTEDCRFCSQARSSTSIIDTYPLLDSETMRRFLSDNSTPPLNRCSLVAAGRRASGKEVGQIAEVLASFGERSANFCVSLGLLHPDELSRLKKAGLTRYHCNLETARSHFGHIVTTHHYEDKLATIAAARDLGLSLCVGGLFGMGETDQQVLELALELRGLRPQAVPVNFLERIPGTPLASTGSLSPQRCLKIIALLRFVLPRQDLLVCGGRATHLAGLQSMVFSAGASGVMTGNYLTVRGRSLEDDLSMISALGLPLRARRACEGPQQR